MEAVYLVVGFIVTSLIILAVVGVALLFLSEFVCRLIQMGRLRHLMRRYDKPMNPENFPWWKIAFHIYPDTAWKLMKGGWRCEVSGIEVPHYPWQKLRRWAGWD